MKGKGSLRRAGDNRDAIRCCGIKPFAFIISTVLTDDDKRWIQGQLEKVETTLLTEFHKWASPVELRQKSHAAALRALDVEVESLSDRLKNLEGR